MPAWNDAGANLPDREAAIRSELSATGGSQTLSQILANGRDAGAGKITNLADPTLAQDAATKNYVDTHGGGSGNFGNLRSISTAYTAVSSDYQILADATSAGVTVTLPAASTVSGQRVLVRKIDSTTNHLVTVAPNGTDTIDGVNASILIRRQYDEIEVVSDGTGWQRVSAIFGNSAGNATGTLYVDGTNGNDSWDGRFPWRPKKTISAAIGNYRTVNVTYGSYTETVDIGGLIGLRLVGASPATDSLSTGTLVVAPTLSSSALQASSAATQCVIENMSFVGTTNNASAYTGTVFDGSHIGSGCKISNITIVGIKGDFTGSKTAIGSGINGGVGLKLDNCEQASYDNVSISNCNIGISVPGTNTYSKVELSNFHLNQCFIVYQEPSSSTTGGDNFYRNWKTQNVYGLTYALAQLNSNGSNPADGDTVLVRDQTYRFKNTMALANDVKIGATIDATLLSLVKAVNGTGVVGTDYFTGTAQPTGVQGGWCNLVDYGAAGANGFTVGAVDTTHHACTFQVTDTLGPAGNAFTFTVTSTNLSDYFGNGAFSRAAWATEIRRSNVWDHIDLMENVSLPAGNACLVAGNGIEFRGMITAPQTQVSVTGSYNYWQMPTFHQAVTVQSGAAENRFFQPYAVDRKAGASPSSSQITDSGTGTVITL